MPNRQKIAYLDLPVSEERRNQQDRRQHNLSTLLYCGWQRRGRRKTPRRVGENYYIDWYDPRLVITSIGILLLSCMDAMLTLTLLNKGAYEANVFMAHLLDINDRTFVIVKMAITSGSVLFLLMHAHFSILRLTTGKQVLQIMLSVYGLLIAYELMLLWRFG
ncbi:MAG: DUF5658 family protein [Gammaproteobacteria bacterium]